LENEACGEALKKNSRQTQMKWLFVLRFAYFALSLQSQNGNINHYMDDYHAENENL